jgi:hypothetical protein
MKPMESAARFAAFAWYNDNRQAPSRITREEARRFADEHWQVFLPVADEGWGRLLNQIAKARPNRQRRPMTRSRVLALAG